ncbi:MAG TPA: DUF4255 domain-containing protein [Actinomycetota bacterium]|nr:DUF4255 domain-containing protein [Actinomycetota bacterium]
MSNFLAIATVTTTLAEVLDTAVKSDVPGATAKPGRPDKVGNGSSPPTVNVFLYQVTPNAAWRNRDLPARDGQGRPVGRSRAALDLHYLLTFHGDEGALEPQRLMGSVVRTLHERPVLSRETIRAAVAAAPPPASLAASDLAEEVDLVKLTPASLNLEELSRLWSVFFQAPYSLSASYLATVVLIDGELAPRRGVPVAAPNLYVVPFRHPVVDAVTAVTGPRDPILAGDAVRIAGKALQGDDTRVLVAGLEVTPLVDDVTDTAIVVALPAALPAGIHGLQVVHRRAMGTPPVPHRGVESNVAAFVLRPRVAEDPGTGAYQISLDNVVTAADGSVSADVTVSLVPDVGRRQRVVLLLNELDAPPERVPFAYQFRAPERQPIDPETSPTVSIPVSGVRPATYLLRVQVDGSESVLDRDAAGKYMAPALEVP